jgi:arginyl-tRNA synthetase
MMPVNPFAEFRVACRNALRDALKRVSPGAAISFTFEVPPNSEFGELSSSVCFELAKLVGGKPLELAVRVAGAVDPAKYPFVLSVRAAGGGYVNFYVDFGRLAQSTLESIGALGNEFGFVKSEKLVKVIVEHTSVNPVHPIHIGTARNSVLGDSVARMLKAQGHAVFRHYYVDDVGRQAAVIAYGYEKLGEPEPEGKPDGFIGRIYAITSCIVEIQKLKQEVEKAKQREEATRLMGELHGCTAAAAELEAANPKMFAKLLDKMSKDGNPEGRIAELNLRYERGENESVKRLIRKVSELCLEGFRQSLGRLGVVYDSWDWESDFVWNGDVGRVLMRLGETPYVFQVGDVIEFDANKVVDDLELRPLLGLSEDYEVPSLTLVRADGTTLYTTRDIPYNLWKFRKADEVINVVGMEQKLAQLHLKIGLAALGRVNEVKRLRHFAYNLVSLPGSKMSGRAGRFITLDETMDEAVKRAFGEVVKRSPQLSDDEKRQISELVGIGAIKYALLQVDPLKPVVFTWDRVLDFERNSAPYIQYSFARAGSILRKAKRKVKKVDYALLKEPVERELILLLAKFPDVFADSVENLRPNQIADYCNSLADRFNSFYGALPVIRAESRALSNARLALVSAVHIVLRNALGLLGIVAPDKM